MKAHGLHQSDSSYRQISAASTMETSTGSDSFPKTTYLLNVSMNYNVSDGEVDLCVKNSFRGRDFTQIPAVAYSLVVIYCAVIVMSVFGNFIVIWTVWRNKHMHTVTNYYIVNLAVCDFLVSSFVMPLKLLEYTAPCHWHVFHIDAVCSFQYYLLPVFVFASVFTLVAISLERYYAIVHPLSSMKIHSKSRTRKIILATWIIPCILASPYLFCRSYSVTIHSELGSVTRQICNDKFDEIDVLMYGPESRGSGLFRTGFFMFLCVSMYIVPMLIIAVTCCRIAVSLLQPVVVKRHKSGSRGNPKEQDENKRKVARMVIVVAAVFAVCWSPQYIVTIISQVQKPSFLRKGNFFFTMLVTHLCGFLNSCINPFIYTLMSKKFRRHIKDTILTCVCCYRNKRLDGYRPQLSQRISSMFTSTMRTSTMTHSTTDMPLSHVNSEPEDISTTMAV